MIEVSRVDEGLEASQLKFASMDFQAWVFW
jgi:hypothetical protein